MKNKIKKLINDRPLTFLSYVLFACGIFCVPFSFIIMLTHYPPGSQDILDIQNLSIFIGIWTLALVSSACFFKNKD